jgi:hypothetical protein
MKQPVLPIEHELVAEKASALAFTAEKLEAALRALAEIEEAIAAAPEAQRLSLAAKHRDLRAHAAERLWFLLVQREAMGLYQHEPVYRLYQVPPALRTIAGPRRPAHALASDGSRS